MKILITGGTGFVGGVLTRYFANKGHEVITTGRNNESRGTIEKYAEFLQWDISQPTNKISVDVCIHSAGLANDQTSYATLYKANVQGTRNVIDSVSCSKFVYISSSSVYDFQTKVHTETESINKATLGYYGRTKYEGEEVVQQFKGSYDSCTMLRPRVIYGKGDRILIPRLITQSNQARIKVPGNLNIQSSFCNVNLLALGVEKIIEKHKGFDIFNVSDVEKYNMKEAFESILSSYYENEIKFTHLPLNILRPIARLCDLLPWETALSSMAVRNLSKDKVLNSSKLYAFLGEKPKHNFKTEIVDIISWYKQAKADLEQSGLHNLAWTNVDQ